MPSFIPIAGVISLLAWLYLILAHGRFWRVRRLGAPKLPPAKITAAIAVVIPARNEADVIGTAVRSLLRQTCADSLRIFVVDDNSTDGTAEAARQAANELSQAEQLTVLAGLSLPDGWTGKLWAVQQGIEQAAQLSPDFFLFTDADIEHAPDNIARLVAIAQDGGYDLASFMVKLHCRNLVEKLLIPAFVFFFLLLYPPRWIRDPRRKAAGAAGGCILIRPAALERAGGIEAIRHEIIDDCALARAVKRTGGRVWLGLAADTRSMRAYNSFAEVESMIARTAFNQLRHSHLASARDRTRNAHRVRAATGAAGKRIAVAGRDWRHRLSAADRNLFPHGAVLPAEFALGADPAIQRGLLCRSDCSFGVQVLVGSRR